MGNKIKSVPVIPGSGGGGYPQTGIGMDNIWVKGKFPAGTKKKQYEDMRGAGAATKGKKFLKDADA
jgi:hypothetical protein